MADTTTPSFTLACAGLEKSFSISHTPHQVLSSISLQVTKGEFIAVMGASGSGKSTLLHILGGLEPPDKGQVLLMGEDLYAMPEERRTAFRTQHAGFIFQSYNLIPTLTAAENVALPILLQATGRANRKNRQASSAAAFARAAELMEQLNLKGLQGHHPDNISGGEQQKIAIARALAPNPELVIADEPTGNLDWNASQEVMKLLSSLHQEQQRTIVMATHEAAAAAFAQTVFVMRDGRLLEKIQLTHENGADKARQHLLSQLAQLGL